MPHRKQGMGRLFGLMYSCLNLLILQVQSQDAPKWSCYPETGSCYYPSDFWLEHPEASCWCRSVGGKLVKIDSLTEMDIIRKLVENEARWEGFYIGATDNRNENQFVWEDGTAVGGNIPWHESGDWAEPDNYDGVENCVALTNKMWWETTPIIFPEFDAMDITCSYPIYFVCEQTEEFMHRTWEEISVDQIYLSAELLTFSSVSKVTCAYHCATTCRCFSIGFRQSGGRCILYDRHSSRLTVPHYAPGYVTYD